jgi:hypothetical protein
MRIVLLAVLCVNLAACTTLPGSELVTAGRGAPPDDGSLKAAVYDGFKNAKLPGNPQISALRESSGPQPGDWMVCFKSDTPDHNIWYAVFFHANAAVVTRRAVMIDGCAKQDYRSLEPELPHWPRG